MRGLITSLVAIDDRVVMSQYGQPVANSADEAGAKAAIDSIYRVKDPDYLMILGAQDVVPFQLLHNPIRGTKDPDPGIESDLPYACDAPFSREPGDFRAPSRVVGRLPDLPGADRPDFLVLLIESATEAETAPLPTEYFALSAEPWWRPSQETLHAVFGNALALRLCPPKGTSWPPGDLGPLLHFINCHGARDIPEFRGEQGRNRPVALTGNDVAGNVTPGTVVAAECCFGGQLFSRSSSDSAIGQPSVCLTYLAGGAVGFLGSTCTAYGSSGSQGRSCADIICEQFLAAVRGGSSLGRATLEARLAFVRACGRNLNPFEVKTLAQFNLLGDPSIHPFMRGSGSDPHGRSLAIDRSERRDELKRLASQVMSESTAAVQFSLDSLPAEEEAILRHLLPPEARNIQVTTYAASEPGELTSRTSRSRAVAVVPLVAYYVMTATVESEDERFPEIHAIVARTDRDTVTETRHLVSR